MAFKLKNQDIYQPNRSSKTRVFKKDLEGSTVAEANMDGTIFIDKSVRLNSELGKRAIKHEMAHLNQIESGRAAYGDDWVMWEDKIYFRRTVDGVDVIDGPNGRWPEGDEHHPWEAEAIEAEKINNTKK